MESTLPRLLCAKEALDLLNCAADSDFHQEKCIRFLEVLRNCVQEKKKAAIFRTQYARNPTLTIDVLVEGLRKVKRFSLAEQSPPEEKPSH